MRYELTDHEWHIIKPFLPNKPRGMARVNDRCVLNGIFWVLRSGAGRIMRDGACSSASPVNGTTDAGAVGANRVRPQMCDCSLEPDDKSHYF